MKRILWALCLLAVFPGVAFSEEPGNMAGFSDEEIIQTVENYIKEHAVESGTFDVYDAKSKTTRKLSLVDVQEDIRKTETHFVVCVDFKDVESRENLDIDVVLSNMEGSLRVVTARIHKINGIVRDSYAAEGIKVSSAADPAVSEGGTGTEAMPREPSDQAPVAVNNAAQNPGSDPENPQPSLPSGDPVTIIPPDSGLPF